MEGLSSLLPLGVTVHSVPVLVMPANAEAARVSHNGDKQEKHMMLVVGIRTMTG